MSTFSNTPSCLHWVFLNSVFGTGVKLGTNLGFLKNNVKKQYSQQQINNAMKKKKIAKNDIWYVPENHIDFHTQMQCIFNDLLRIMKNKRGIKWTFTIDGKQITEEYRLFFPVLFFV